MLYLPAGSELRVVTEGREQAKEKLFEIKCVLNFPLRLISSVPSLYVTFIMSELQYPSSRSEM